MQKRQIEILKKLGLNEGESKVYLFLTQKGTACKASEISNGIDLNRSNLYRILDNLFKKKLLFWTIKGNIKYFAATRPDRLKELYIQKIEEFKEFEKDVSFFVRNHEKMPKVNMSKLGFSVEVYEGIDDVKNIISSILRLKKGEVVYSFGKEGLMAKYPKIVYWFDSFILQRSKKKILFKAVYNIHPQAKSAKSKYTEIKYAKLCGMEDMEISFYRDLLMIYVITENSPRVILIKNREIVNSMKSYFNFLWGKSKIIG